MRKVSYEELERSAEISMTHMITGDMGMPVYQLNTNICPISKLEMFLGYYKDGVVTLQNEPVLNDLHTKLYDFVHGTN